MAESHPDPAVEKGDISARCTLPAGVTSNTEPDAVFEDVADRGDLLKVSSNLGRSICRSIVDDDLINRFRTILLGDLAMAFSKRSAWAHTFGPTLDHGRKADRQWNDLDILKG
jgi:hypothetical protein